MNTRDQPRDYNLPERRFEQNRSKKAKLVPGTRNLSGSELVRRTTNSLARVTDGAGRLRVLRVIARMNVGGPALQVTGLVEGMDPDRFDHRLLVGSVGPGEADYVALRAPDLALTTLPGLGRSPRPFDDARALRALVREMRAFRPHIVHTHTAKAGVLGRTAAKIARTPAVVHTFHGHLLHGYFSPAVTRAVVQTERVLARGTDRLVSVGARVRDDLLAAGIGKPDQYVVVAPGIWLPPQPARGAARSTLGLPAGGPVVVFVARLTAIKRPERFIEVARRLEAAHPTAVFVVVGEGDKLPALKTAAPANVRFLGWRGDVEAVYAASDLVVLTSDNEGMPVSLIEAALCGVPAVATAVGSVAEVVLDGRAGWLCPPDVSALTAAVEAALSSGVLADFGAAARAHATAAFGRDRLVADSERLYEELAAEKGL
jgi:glycosyltransferase involved in cell wall biosynthesis